MRRIGNQSGMMRIILSQPSDLDVKNYFFVCGTLFA
jgi:hypothetical protein